MVFSIYSSVWKIKKAVLFRSLPNHLKHWHQLYLQRCSNTPQKCLRFPGNCAPGLPSETTVSTAPERVLTGHPATWSVLACLVCLPWCSKCEHTYQRSRWPGASHRGWRPRCTRVPGAWSVCEYKHLAPHPTVAPSSQMRHCQRVMSCTFVNKMSIIHSIIQQVTSGQIWWVLSKSCKFLWYLNYTFTHTYTSRSEITTVGPLNLLDTDFSSEYQTNSHVPVPYVYTYLQFAMSTFLHLKSNVGCKWMWMKHEGVPTWQALCWSWGCLCRGPSGSTW